ncbi:MAG: tetratricopeptide repeat protein [Bryobacteraceae bacterium]
MRGFRSGLLAFTLATGLAQSPDDLGAKSRRATQAMAEKRFAEAAALYRELIAAVPGNAGLHMNLGLALHSTRQYREALEQFETAARLQPDLAPAHLLLGMTQLKLGQPAKAIDPLKQALALQPSDAMACLELADAYLSLARFDEAAAQFRRLTELDARSPKAWHGLGLAYVSLSRAAFAELEKTAGQSAYWYALLARSRAEQGQHGTAYHFYRRALEVKPAFRGIHPAIAEIYRATGRAEWAAKEQAKEARLPRPDCNAEPIECAFAAGRYEQVLQLTRAKRTAEALYWRSRAAGELASAAFLRLGQLPPSSSLHELLAEAHGLQGNYAAAAAEWRKALALAPSDSRLERGLARSLWMGREYEQARPLLEKLVRREASRTAELHYQLGDTIFRLQGAEEALPHLTRAAAQDATLLPTRALLGRVLLDLGQAEKAIPHLKAALPEDADGSTLFQLSRAYRAVGQAELARQTLAQYQEKVKSRGVEEGGSATLEVTEP